MTKIDTKEIFEIAYAFKNAQWASQQPIKFLPQAHKFGEDVLNLIDAYDEAQKRIVELEEVTTNHCDLNQDRVLRLEVLLREVKDNLEYKNKVKVYDYSLEDYSDLKACLVCGNDSYSRYPHADFCIFTRIQKELGEG